MAEPFNYPPYFGTPDDDTGGTGTGSGTVTTIPDGSTNGVTWTVANRTTTPTFTFDLIDITPNTVNSVAITGGGSLDTNGFDFTGGSTGIIFTSADTLPASQGGTGLSLTAAIGATTALAISTLYTGAISTRTFTLPNVVASARKRIHFAGTAAASTVITWPGGTVRQVGGSGFTASTTFAIGNVEFDLYSDGTDWYLSDSTGSAGSGTVTSVGFTGGIVSVATATSTPAFTVAGTSGGIPYFASSSTWATSAALAANAIVIGGGAGAAPATTTTGTGVLTFLGTPSSANLAAAVTDETGSGLLVFATSPTLTTPVLGTPTSGTLTNCTADGTNLLGYRGAPQNSQSAAYTTVLADAGKSIFHPVGDNNARTFTIDSNANVAFPIGTIIEFINMAATASTIAITTDTMTLLPAGTTGSRTLAQFGRASAEKITSTSWIISGNSALT